jgi:hypothetical protein
VASAEVRNRKISEEAAKVFKNAKSGPLLDVRSNKWDQAHIAYNRAIGEALDDYLKKAGTVPENMTAAQAGEFLGKVFESSDPRIRNYNIGFKCVKSCSGCFVAEGLEGEDCNERLGRGAGQGLGRSL